MRTWATLAGVACLVVPFRASADDVDACVESADRGQQLRDQGKLIEARKELLTCGASACPAAVAKQCARWLQDVDGQLPTVSFRVRDAAGADVADVRVTLDGAPWLESIDGRPVMVNPGAHRVGFQHTSSPPLEELLVIRSGEKNRLVDIRLTSVQKLVEVVPVVTPVPEKSAFRFPVLSWVFLGVSVAGFVTTGALVASANDRAGQLRRTCAPACASSDVDAVNLQVTMANVTFGVGVGGLALSALFVVLANVGPRSHPPDRGVAFSLTPIDHGAALGAAGVF